MAAAIRASLIVAATLATGWAVVTVTQAEDMAALVLFGVGAGLGFGVAVAALRLTREAPRT